MLLVLFRLSIICIIQIEIETGKVSENKFYMADEKKYLIFEKEEVGS